METLLIKAIADAIAAGGLYAVFGFILLLIGGPVVAGFKIFQNQRKDYEAKLGEVRKEVSELQDERTDDLKAVITEANKCMQAVSTAITNMMIAVERSTASNESRLRSWEGVSVSLDHYGKALNSISEELRDIRRGLRT